MVITITQISNGWVVNCSAAMGYYCCDMNAVLTFLQDNYSNRMRQVQSEYLGGEPYKAKP